MKDFTIYVPIEIDGEEQEIEVDLSQPAYEKQVLSAAGRFRALKRVNKSGPKSRPMICPDCGGEVSVKKIGEHRKNVCNATRRDTVNPPVDGR